jgi:methionyl-tRNA formyltransferase
MTKVVVIGNLRLVVDALTVMHAHQGCDIEWVISHPGLRGIGNFVGAWCAKHGIPHSGDGDIHSAAALDRFSRIAPDFIFSIYNPTIIKPALLAIPTRGTVNFHAGPLPAYRGLNTFSWAILNGETEYGVAWHDVDEGIDTGQVLFQRRFGMAADETALTLFQKSFNTGIDLLRERLGALLDGTLVPEGAPPGPSSYYGRKDVPEGGLIRFSWPLDRIDRFVRALRYHPVPNPFVMATSSYGGTQFYPLKVVRAGYPASDAAQAPTGSVLAIDAEQIVVQAGDGPVAIIETLNARQRKLKPGRLAKELGLQVGLLLDCARHT